MRSPTNTNGPTRRRLTAGQLEEFRSALQEQFEFRTEQLTALATDDTVTPTGDPRDEVTDALRAGALAALRDIRGALARLETGAFGVCANCTEAIPVERLEILPMSALCMPCARVRAHRAR